MGLRLMVGMMRDMSHAGGDHDSVRDHQAQQQRPDQSGMFLRQAHLVLAQCRGFHRFLFLYAGHNVVDLLLGEKPSLDVLLHDALLIDEDADR